MQRIAAVAANVCAYARRLEKRAGAAGLAAGCSSPSMAIFP
jgi:hypothetical protein